MNINRNAIPANLPEDRPVRGKTSNTQYLYSGWTWEPQMMMRTVHLRVVEINDIQKVSY